MSGSRTFTITAEQWSKYQAWQREQDRKVSSQQNQEYANYGACGGGYQFCFSPTGLGMVVIVKNSITGDELDLTEYDLF